MDLNEVTGEIRYRHPWELSRTACTKRVIDDYLKKLPCPESGRVYVNIGAGDCYFDRSLLAEWKRDRAYVVDIGYPDLEPEGRRILKHHYLEEVREKQWDYAVMMDSLEYMEDDAGYIRKVVSGLKQGGYFFLTLPAFPFLYSEFDVYVKNLRRYSRKSFGQVVREIPELEIEEEFYFYSSLFLVRLVKKLLKVSIDPQHKITAQWNYSEKNILTAISAGCLDLDFLVNRWCAKRGVCLPGLSMMAVCRKK